jgi:hypothetical protein
MQVPLQKTKSLHKASICMNNFSNNWMRESVKAKHEAN